MELCLKVRERERLRDSAFDSYRVSNVGRLGLRSNSDGGGGGFAPVLASCSAGEGGALDASAVAPSAATAGYEVGCAPLSCPNSAGGGVGVVLEEVVRSAGERGGPDSSADVGEGVRSSTAGESAGIARPREFESARATAGERSGGIGLLEVSESDFPSLSCSVNSCLGLSTSACAVRLVLLLLVLVLLLVFALFHLPLRCLLLHMPRLPGSRGYWSVVQGRTPLVTLLRKREYANGGVLEPVRRSKIMHPLAQR